MALTTVSRDRMGFTTSDLADFISDQQAFVEQATGRTYVSGGGPDTPYLTSPAPAATRHPRTRPRTQSSSSSPVWISRARPTRSYHMLNDGNEVIPVDDPIRDEFPYRLCTGFSIPI